MEKRCIVCGKKFIPIKFHSSAQIYCSEKCRKAFQSKKYYDNHEQIIAQRKQKYQDNHEDIIQQRRQKYQLEHDKINVKRREKYVEDKEIIHERNKRSYQRHKDKRRFYVSWVSQGHKARGVQYDVFIEQFENKWKQQDGKCAICHKQFNKKGDGIIDHDHISGKLRGLLCRDCNFGLGHFKDRKDFIMSAIEYIKTNNRDIPKI